jgi:exonuclease III
MSVLSWNCRGLGNPGTVRDLHRMVKEKGPDLVFLMETKMQNKKCDFIRIKLGFDYMFGVDSVGRSGGLLLLWKNDYNVAIQNYNR